MTVESILLKQTRLIFKLKHDRIHYNRKQTYRTFKSSWVHTKNQKYNHNFWFLFCVIICLTITIFFSLNNKCTYYRYSIHLWSPGSCILIICKFIDLETNVRKQKHFRDILTTLSKKNEDKVTICFYCTSLNLILQQLTSWWKNGKKKEFRKKIDSPRCSERIRKEVGRSVSIT